MTFEASTSKAIHSRRFAQVIARRARSCRVRPAPATTGGWRRSCRLAAARRNYAGAASRASCWSRPVPDVHDLRRAQPCQGHVLPGRRETARRELRPEYNRAGALDSIALDGMPFVERIAYNAKGQRSLIAYGNGVMTRYAYDPQTFRLVRLRSERYSQPTRLPTIRRARPLQDSRTTTTSPATSVKIRDRASGKWHPEYAGRARRARPALRVRPDYRLCRPPAANAAPAPRHAPWLDSPRATT